MSLCCGTGLRYARTTPARKSWQARTHSEQPAGVQGSGTQRADSPELSWLCVCVCVCVYTCACVQYGGGLYSSDSGGSYTWQGCRFVSNSASLFGGGAYVSDLMMLLNKPGSFHAGVVMRGLATLSSY